MHRPQQPREDFIMPVSSFRAGRTIAAAAILPAVFFAISAPTSSAAEYSAQAASRSAPSAVPKMHAASVDRIEDRITALHKQLRVTPEQEPLWSDLAQVMRTNGKKMRDDVAQRSAKRKTMNAVDDLRSYEMITDEHADGLKRLIPAFEALYAKMTPAQQKHADYVFGEQERTPAHRS
jgi:protein CpxP